MSTTRCCSWRSKDASTGCSWSFHQSYFHAFGPSAGVEHFYPEGVTRNGFWSLIKNPQFWDLQMPSRTLCLLWMSNASSRHHLRVMHTACQMEKVLLVGIAQGLACAMKDHVERKAHRPKVTCTWLAYWTHGCHVYFLSTRLSGEEIGIFLSLLSVKFLTAVRPPNRNNPFCGNTPKKTNSDLPLSGWHFPRSSQETIVTAYNWTWSIVQSDGMNVRAPHSAGTRQRKECVKYRALEWSRL